MLSKEAADRPTMKQVLEQLHIEPISREPVPERAFDFEHIKSFKKIATKLALFITRDTEGFMAYLEMGEWPIEGIKGKSYNLRSASGAPENV